MNRVQIKKWEVFGLFLLYALAAAMVWISWRKWLDPLIDFGRELYLPWAMVRGDVLYKDVDANYGPLSQAVNAMIFKLWGPGLMYLVAMNLIVYACILGLMYMLLRRVWGGGTAFMGCVFFILVFSFNHFTGVANYNFATPYAHETTHGFLLLLALLACLDSWLTRPSFHIAIAVGILDGLALLLKAEIVLAAAMCTFVGVVFAVVRRYKIGVRALIGHLVLFLVGGFAPPLIATVLLWNTGRFEIKDAFLWANVAWTFPFLYKGIASDQMQASLLGVDRFWENLSKVSLVGLASLTAVFAWATISKVVARLGRIICAISAAFLVFGAWYFSRKMAWLEMGTVFPVWLIFLIGFSLIRNWKMTKGQVEPLLWLMVCIAIALLARMALNPRVYHYGYCQAAMAGVLAMATVWTLVPQVMKMDKVGLYIYRFGIAICIGWGLWQMQVVSQRIYALKTQSIGEGEDQFYAFDAHVEPTGAFFEQARLALKQAPEGGRLLVLPEGVMLNYLARRPLATRVYAFNSYWLKWTDDIVRDLDAKRPDYVLLISRDLREYGIGKFGETAEHGGRLLDWVVQNCVLLSHVGGDPLDPNQRGAAIFATKASAATH